MNNRKPLFYQTIFPLGICGRHIWIPLLALLSSLGWAKAGSTYEYSLPECPVGTIVKIYGPIQESSNWLAKLPKLDKTIDVRDAKPYFESRGIKFPKNGFALYFGRTHTLIVATTSEDEDMLAFLLDA